MARHSNFDRRINFMKILQARRRRHVLKACLISCIHQRRQTLLKISALLMLLFSSSESTNAYRKPRLCRRLIRNIGWWDIVWCSYSEARFRKTFRVSRETFMYILSFIRNDLEKQTITEVPISPECRLAICLYRLGRGDYYYTISEMVGVGVATVCQIVIEVCDAIVKRMWKESVGAHFPKTEDMFREKIIDMDERWQFPCSWAAVDGCHLPLKCPPGGQTTAKEYHNFKNFYSVVLMALVDAKYRFIWASVGYPGNSHDSIIFQSTHLWQEITENQAIPLIGKDVDSVNIQPVILGDGAFPLKSWLMKPYGNAAMTSQQKYFNYRLSRARMVTEAAYGQLKGRWRLMHRKSESTKEVVRATALACIVLHNICIECNDQMPAGSDLTVDPATNKRRDREKVRRLLKMRECRRIQDTNKKAEEIRSALTKKFWNEKEGHGVI